MMPCLINCFGAKFKSTGPRGCDALERPCPCAGATWPLTGGRGAIENQCAEHSDSSGLISLLTGEVPHGEWWDILQSACKALTKHLRADHASIFIMAGAGMAALATSGVPLFGLRLGQLLLPMNSGTSNTGASDERFSPLVYHSELGACILAAALQDQMNPVPLVYRSVALSKGPEQHVQQSQAEAKEKTKALTCGQEKGSSRKGRPYPQMKRQKAKHGWAITAGAPHQRHFVAVGIPGGKSVAGMFILSTAGPAQPVAWQVDGSLGLVAALLAPLLRPPQVPLARRTLAEVHIACTINDLVHALSAAAGDLVAVAVRVAMQPRVALLRNDGTAAAVFIVSESGPGGGIHSAVCRRQSREVVLVDGGGSGFSSCKSPDFFMFNHQPPYLDRGDSVGTPVAAGTTGCGTGGGALGGKSGGDAALNRLPGGASALSMPCGPGCRGQSMPLQHTLLAEALSRGSGLCIADCNAYVQDRKAFPRDLMVVPRGGGSTSPPQSLALATSCHGGRPLLALYATYHSILPQALLQTVVQELGQLLRALTPTVAALLQPGGPISDEWSLLHDDLLGPTSMGLSSSYTANRERTRKSRAASPQPAAAAVPAATTIAAVQTIAAACAARADHHHPPPGQALQSAGCGGGKTATTAAIDSYGGGSTLHACAGLPRFSGGGPPPAATAPGGMMVLGVMSQIGAFFLRRRGAATGNSSLNSPNASRCTAAADGEDNRGRVKRPNGAALATAVTATAPGSGVGGEGGGDGATSTADMDGQTDIAATASKRLVAFVSGDAAASSAASPGMPLFGSLPSVASRTALAHSHTGRTSFSLEAVGSPRGGVRLAPLLTTLHDRLKHAQAEQLTASSRAASRMQDLESLRFLERVGKGGYGSVYRGLYHGSEVAIKVVEDVSLGNTSAAVKSATDAYSVTLRAKHLHDAIELVASVSMSHPNIVQLITSFVDVRVHYPQRTKGPHAACSTLEGAVHATMAAAAEGGGGPTMDSESEPLHLVHLTSLGINSEDNSFTEPGGNEAIVLVMEYCDRGSLKDAIQGGSFLQREAMAQVIALHRQQQQQSGQQQQQQQQQQLQQALAVARGGTGLLNMKAVYSTLLEVALALRHVHSLHMVHCDLKPQNVLLKSSPRDPRGFTAKLSDFGLAKMMAHDEEGQLVIDEAIQSGTITHLPPEALTGGRHLGPAVDIYAFGIVMFQILCGMSVYRGMDVKQIIRGVVRHGLRPAVPIWVPPEYRDLVQRCWHEQPSCRPTSLQLVSELEALLQTCDCCQLGTQSHRGSGAGIAGSVGIVRSAAGGCGAAVAAASLRRLPPRCATETAIQGTRLLLPPPPATCPPGPLMVTAVKPWMEATPAAGDGNLSVVAVPAPLPSVGVVLRHPLVGLYRSPQLISHRSMSATEPAARSSVGPGVTTGPGPGTGAGTGAGPGEAHGSLAPPAMVTVGKSEAVEAPVHVPAPAPAPWRGACTNPDDV